MTYDLADSERLNIEFDSEYNKSEGSRQVKSVNNVIENLKALHRCTDEDLHKIAIGIGFFGKVYD